MKDFIEKWQSDSKFKAKVQLGLYTTFVVLVSIFAISSRGNVQSTNTLDINQTYNENGEINTSINIPKVYNYTTNIILNDKKYQYKGTIENNKEIITKTKDEITTNFIYQDEEYYQKLNEEYILTTKENVYDVVSLNYLKLETINQYLSKSQKENDKYIVYLKDIILGNDSEKYITIILNDNEITVDYTQLMSLFDETIENLSVEIIIEEKE